MLVQVITENGTKKLKPLTADAGAGNPVGTVIVVCSNQIPSNYLSLGTQYDTSLYPVLYALLGTDTTPTASALGLPTLTSGQYAIKATSGLSENAQDNVVAQLNEQRSYSTEEHLTGRKWINGKPTYEKTFLGGITSGTISVAHNIQNIDTIVTANPVMRKNNGDNVTVPFYSPSPAYFYGYATKTNIEIRCSNSYSGTFDYQITVEYTKTTD
jgi:hypothetical protein